MRYIKGVQSSNKDFIQTEVNIDTVFVRVNEEKWYREIEGKSVHVGWIYDEYQYTIQEYIEYLQQENSLLSSSIIEVSNTIYEDRDTTEEAIIELTNLILGGM